jgi:hypothetical protein
LRETSTIAALEISIRDRAPGRASVSTGRHAVRGDIAVAVRTIIRELEVGAAMTARPTARRVAAMLDDQGIRPPPLSIIELSVRSAFKRLEGRDLRRVEGSRIRWVVEGE